MFALTMACHSIIIWLTLILSDSPNKKYCLQNRPKKDLNGFVVVSLLIPLLHMHGWLQYTQVYIWYHLLLATSNFMDVLCSWSKGLLGVRVGEASHPGPPGENSPLPERERSPRGQGEGGNISMQDLTKALGQLRVDIRQDISQELESVKGRVSTVEQGVAEFRATQAPDRLSYRARALAATEKALLNTGAYAQSIILSNWTSSISRAQKEKMINDTLANMRKKYLKVDFLPEIIRVKFESEDTAVAFKKAWKEQGYKNGNNAPIFAARDSPKEVRFLRAELRAVAKAVKKAGWENGQQKIQTLIKWEEGGVLYVNGTKAAERRDDGEIVFSIPEVRETYLRYKTASAQASEGDRPAKAPRRA